MLGRLAAEIERSWPDAAASLREGMAETLTLMGLGVARQPRQDVVLDERVRSMIELVRHTQRDVKRWQDADMRKRWTAAGMLQAEQQFPRIMGYSDLAKLVSRSSDVTSVPNTPTPRSAPRHRVRRRARYRLTITIPTAIAAASRWPSATPTPTR